MHTCMCRKYPITHVNMQEHPTYSNCHTPIYIMKKKTHFHAQSVASNFTPNLYPKHLLFTNYLHMFEIYIIQIFLLFHPHLCILARYLTLCTYLHSKGNPVLSYIHLGRDLNIPSPFTKNFMPFIFTHISTHHWKTFPTLLRCKVPIMGQPKFLQTNPYFHAFLILKPNFGFLATSMFPCIEATSLGS